MARPSPSKPPQNAAARSAPPIGAPTAGAAVNGLESSQRALDKLCFERQAQVARALANARRMEILHWPTSALISVFLLVGCSPQPAPPSISTPPQPVIRPQLVAESERQKVFPKLPPRYKAVLFVPRSPIRRSPIRRSASVTYHVQRAGELVATMMVSDLVQETMGRKDSFRGAQQ